MSVLDIVGKKFDRLTVIKRVDNNKKNNSMWECKCECGKITKVLGYHLISGHTKSCGGHKAKYSPKESTARWILSRKYSDGNLSIEDFIKLTKMNCYYCGEKPSNIAKVGSDYSDEFKKDGELFYSGLDRIDCSKGHILGNLISCCKYCNYAKRNMSVEEFSEWIKLIYNHSCREMD